MTKIENLASISASRRTGAVTSLNIRGDFNKMGRENLLATG